MPLVTLLDLEKVNQMMNHQKQVSQFTDIVTQSPSNNSATNIAQQQHLQNQANVANALLHQFQSQNKLFTNNTLILNCIQANAAHLIQAQNSENQKQINYSRYKTELCRQFIENGECKYGDKCQFAHGMHDLKDVNRHPKYKTDYCKTFHSKGFCPYGPRCHFIHELHEKFDPSIQNVSQGTKKTKDSSSDSSDDGLIDKQLEEIQNQLATSLFVSDEICDSSNFKVNEVKKQLTNDCGEKVMVETSHSSCSSGSSSPQAVSSSSTSSYASTSNSASVSSCTSPVLNRAVRKPIQKTKNCPSIFDNKIKNLFDGAMDEQSKSPMNTPRTRSSTSSTSSACSSTSSSSFELEEISNQQSVGEAFSSQVKQQEQRPKLAPTKNLGPIGRPSVQSPNLRATNSSTQGIFDIERINNLLMQQNTNTNQHNSSLNQTSNSFSKSFFNATQSPESQFNNGYNNQQFSYNQNQTSAQLSRQSSWQ